MIKDTKNYLVIHQIIKEHEELGYQLTRMVLQKAAAIYPIDDAGVKKTRFKNKIVSLYFKKYNQAIKDNTYITADLKVYEEDLAVFDTYVEYEPTYVKDVVASAINVDAAKNIVENIKISQMVHLTEKDIIHLSSRTRKFF